MNTKQPDDFFGIWDELLWRGLVKDSTGEHELREMLNNHSITFFCGFDPTAASLHVGNLLQMITMRRLQQAGHKPLFLIGGSTGLIGDPRPTTERTLQTKETVSEWVDRLKKQGSLFFPDGVEMVNNLDWFGEMNAIDFLRDIGKFFSVNTMLKKKSVQSRLESENGISFTEFAYQLMQGQDFLHLFQTQNCVLQTGGSDQWGNMTGGTDLIHTATGKKAHAFSTPLVMNSDGTKFGKSEGNAVWLDSEMTSPFKFFQFWLNTADADVFARLKQFTFLGRDEILGLEIEKQQNPSSVAAQQKLAFAMTSFVHGKKTAEMMQEVSAMLFGRQNLADIPESTLADVVVELKAVPLLSGITIASAAVHLGLVSTLSEARRLVKQQGLRVNNFTIKDADETLTQADFLHQKFLILRKGKKFLAAGFHAE